MAEHTDHLDEQDQSRPFLASTEAHEAILMKEVKHKSGQSAADTNDPAPLLPPIVNHDEAESSSSSNDANEPTSDASVTPNPTHNSINPENLADEHELSPNHKNVYYPNSRRMVASMTAALIALAGFSALWYSANQDIYTLGLPEEHQDGVSRAANKAHQPQATQPATLGAETTINTATLSLNNLPGLAQGQYHLWIKQGDKVTSLGHFSVNDQGQATTGNDQDFKPKLKRDQAETTIFITIETDKNPQQPSSTVILSGQLEGSQAKLSYTAIDLSQASGVYTIAAPTDLSGDYQSSGIWFAKSDGHSLTEPGLIVPNAPEGWKYEAQLVYKDQIIAAGRFSNPNDRDDFGVFTPNPDHTPNFPGEDYIQGAPSRLGLDFPANLVSGEWKVIISIEPDQNGADPTGDDIFYLQPFTATIAEGTANYQEQPLTLDLTKFPTATVSLNR